MTNDGKPWWWPQEVNGDWYKRLREDYPQKVEGWSDAELLNYFGNGSEKFTDVWDHLRDAREEYEKLARAFLDLVEETGKRPQDF